MLAERMISCLVYYTMHDCFRYRREPALGHLGPYLRRQWGRKNMAVWLSGVMGGDANHTQLELEMIVALAEVERLQKAGIDFKT